MKSRHPLWSIWKGILSRCNPKNAEHYQRYAGRGISVCDRWKESFEAFVEDMGPRPSATHSIDRINNDGNYEPGNCRWATKGLQRRNSVAVHLITVDGVTKCAMDWANERGIPIQTLYRRLQRGGSVAEALYFVREAPPLKKVKKEALKFKQPPELKRPKIRRYVVRSIPKCSKRAPLFHASKAQFGKLFRGGRVR